MRLDVLARVFTTVLLEGAWEPFAMLERLRATTGEPQPWMQALIDAACDSFVLAPDRRELTSWLRAQDALREAVRQPTQIRRWPDSPPAMADSPWHVPALATQKELARWLGLDVGQLEVLADRRGLSRSARDPRMRHYRYTWVSKRAGGHRLLEAPKLRLRTVQRYLLDDIVARIPPHDAVYGFRTGRSVIGFATPHVGRDVVVRLDLQAFFNSVFAPRIAAMFRAAGYPEAIARTLAALCTHRTPEDVLAGAPTRAAVDLARLRSPHLPQGAPTSGALANLAAYRLDVRIAALAEAVGAGYTRYADDLAVSGPPELARAAPTLIARIGAIAIDEGFSLNFRKTRVMTASTRQRLTGLVVNDKLAVPRAALERLRAILHNCVRTGPAPQNLGGHPDFRAHLLGRIAWVAAIDAAKGARLRAQFDRIRWDDVAR